MKKTDLRQRAERVLADFNAGSRHYPSDDIKRLVEELHIYQIELEMQNEELLKREAELEASHRKYADLYDFSPVGYCTADKQGIIREINLTAAKRFGKERSLLLNMQLYHYIPLEDHDVFFLYLRKIFATHEHQTCELRLIGKDGVIFHAQLEGIPTAEDTEELGQCRIAISDITEMKNAEEERKTLESRLRQSQSLEAIGTLAGGIAHDLNNILFPIIGYTEMTTDELPRCSRAYQNLQEVLKAAFRAKELVNRILTFGRQSEQEKTILKIQPIVKEALKMFRSTIPATIQITQNIDPNCSSVIGDPTQIYQIVMNLCTNAYHAMQENGGKLEVTLTQTEMKPEDAAAFPGVVPGQYLKLSVSDTGVGIPKDIRNRIFDPFFTTKPVGRGTGLGLSVVHGIVTQMGGHIRVCSELGKGTVFHVSLPAVISEIVSMSDLSECDERMPTGSEHILLLDDEQSVLDMLRISLGKLGYRITSHTDSTEAFNAFQSRPDSFDMVITDMTMPNMTGVQLAKQLLEIRPDIPIILCTGFSEQINGKKAETVGIRGYLMKPVSISDMAKTIRKVFEKTGK